MTSWPEPKRAGFKGKAVRCEKTTVQTDISINSDDDATRALSTQRVNSIFVSSSFHRQPIRPKKKKPPNATHETLFSIFSTLWEHVKALETELSLEQRKAEMRRRRRKAELILKALFAISDERSDKNMCDWNFCAPRLIKRRTWRLHLIIIAQCFTET